MIAGQSRSDLWPEFSSPAFEPTRHLLHMVLQAIGKLKLMTPFQAQWAEVPLWLSSRGLTTGPIPYKGGAFEVRVDLVSHETEWFASSGASGKLPLGPTSVAIFVETFLNQLRHAGIDTSIKPRPQEVPNAIPFNEDREQRPYDRDLANAWWRILLSAQRVLQAFQGRFTGKTQPIGLMWGTLDIRAAFYNGKAALPDSKLGYIRRNAMNAELIEMGWWSGDAAYPRPAFYSFTYPQPQEIENARIDPRSARWDGELGEFLLDYDDLRQSRDPDHDLLKFFDSTYRAGAAAAAWDPGLLGSGNPE
jgi:hypothetical protein